MRRRKFTPVLPILAVAVLCAVLGGVACSPGTAAPPDKEQTAMDVLKSAMAYIKAHHADAAAVISADTAFTQTGTGGRVVGYTSATYSGGGWNVSVGRAVVPDPVSEIKADYSGGQINWTGTEKGGVITELSYKKSD